MLNYVVEREAHVRPHSEPSSKTHEETTNQSYLFHGDLLPGTRFRLDDPSTVYREYLKIKKESDNTLPYTTGARQLAAHPDNYSQEQIARLLLEEVLNEKGGYKSDPEEGEVVGAGTVIRRGDDVCRHKAAMLVQCLQETGIKAQYVRGYITGKARHGIISGRHAWVHAELDGIPHRLDPQWGVFKTLEESKKVRVPTEGNPSYSPESGTNVVWRRKRAAF